MLKTLMMIIVIVAACGLPRTAHGQHVHKCVSGNHVSYQSEPCKDPRQLAGRWDATPEAVAPAFVVAPLARSKQTHPSAVRRSSALNAGTTRSRSVRESSRTLRGAPARSLQACQAARAERDATERKLGLKRDYKTLQALGQQMREACR